MVAKNDKNTNPISQEKVLNRLVSFFKKFNKVFDNEKIDEIVYQEFPRQYALLPLLVKAQIYYDEQ